MDFFLGVLFARIFLFPNKEKESAAPSAPAVPFRERPRAVYLFTNMRANPWRFGAISLLRVLGAGLFCLGLLRMVAQALIPWRDMAQAWLAQTTWDAPPVGAVMRTALGAGLPWVASGIIALLATDLVLKRASWLIRAQPLENQ